MNTTGTCTCFAVLLQSKCQPTAVWSSTMVLKSFVSVMESMLSEQQQQKQKVKGVEKHFEVLPREHVMVCNQCWEVSMLK